MGMSFRWYIYGDRADDLLISRLRKLSSAIIVSVCVRRLLRVRCVSGERKMKAEGLIQQVGNGTKTPSKRRRSRHGLLIPLLGTLLRKNSEKRPTVILSEPLKTTLQSYQKGLKNQPEIIYMMGSSFGDTLIIFSSAICLHHVFRHFSSSSIVSVSV